MGNGPFTAHVFFFALLFFPLLFHFLSFALLFLFFSLPDNNFFVSLNVTLRFKSSTANKNLKKKRPCKMRIAGIPRSYGIGSIVDDH